MNSLKRVDKSQELGKQMILEFQKKYSNYDNIRIK